MATTTEPDAPLAQVAGPAPEPALVKHARKVKTIIVSVAGVGAVLSGLVGYYTSYKAVNGAPAAPAAVVNPLSIVVLPFTNQTGDPAQAYVADGLTTSVTADLSRIRDAYVVNAAAAAANKDKDPQQVGRTLGVRYVLQGSVQRSGTKIRINAQLADAGTNAQLWTESFDGDQADLFALQDQVTTRIGNTIGREMVVYAARQTEQSKGNAKVGDLLLRARAMNMNQRTLAYFNEIEGLWRGVLEIEPDNVLALATLAANMAFRASYFSHTLEPALKEKYYQESRALAEHAKRLDPDFFRSYITLMLYAESHDDYPGQLRNAEKAVSLAPKDQQVANALGHTLLMGGDPKRAKAVLEEAMKLDPKRPIDQIAFNLGWAAFMVEDYDTSIEWFQRIIDANSTYIDAYGWMSMAHAIKGDMARSREERDKLLKSDPKGSFATRRRPMPSSPQAFKDFYQLRVLPAAAKAGIPGFPPAS
jgi:adenylate cyclase